MKTWHIIMSHMSIPLTEDALLHVKHQTSWIFESIWHNMAETVQHVLPRGLCGPTPLGVGLSASGISNLGAWKHQTRDSNHLHKCIAAWFSMILYHFNHWVPFYEMFAQLSHFESLHNELCALLRLLFPVAQVRTPSVLTARTIRRIDGHRQFVHWRRSNFPAPVRLLPQACNSRIASWMSGNMRLHFGDPTLATLPHHSMSVHLSCML